MIEKRPWDGRVTTFVGASSSSSSFCRDLHRRRGWGGGGGGGDQGASEGPESCFLLVCRGLELARVW